MASERTVLRIMGKVLWDTNPTETDLAARQLAVALGYPVGWRVVRTIEITGDYSSSNTSSSNKVIVDRIHAGKPGEGCDMWFHHAAAMQAASVWIDGESTAFDNTGGHLLPRLPKFQKGDKVEVLYEEEWWEAKIVRRKDHVDSFRYQVHYAADNSKQSGVEEDLIRPRKADVDPEKTAIDLGLGEGWQAVALGAKAKRWTITDPTGEVYKSKKNALDAYAKIVASEKEMADGDPPWRREGNEYLGRRVKWTMNHSVSARRTVPVDQVGTVVGYISETDVDNAGEPGFVSEQTGKPAKLFHVSFDDDPHHPYASYLVQSQDLEEYELTGGILPEESQSPAKKKARKR